MCNINTYYKYIVYVNTSSIYIYIYLHAHMIWTLLDRVSSTDRMKPFRPVKWLRIGLEDLQNFIVGDGLFRDPEPPWEVQGGFNRFVDPVSRLDAV